MPHMNKTSTNQHHCPLRSKGNCRLEKQFSLKFCVKHLTACIDHKVVHIKTEECWKCERLSFDIEEMKASKDREVDKKKGDKSDKKSHK
ncbi:hypothetical protein F4813DRAFT_76029 [Daldinia decipiens]|uniref:uncharacterized protein n=1 Tax=Daldinia decipiens TaxID=326647 RepID=UPI0020C30B07|nr:uncharacterized protein F4813DRAFT_76029 [Daldinia decipiens]KAI1657426.1 hypothetical protein F4813DRAFT_76029 [Daldinia decipiens]